jgi:hypothetical protein
MAFLCVSQQGEFKNTKNLFGVNPCQKLLAEKVEKKKLFSCRLSHRFFLIAFLTASVSLLEEPKNTIKIFSKIRPKNLKKSPKKVGRWVRRFFFSFGAPWTFLNFKLKFNLNRILLVCQWPPIEPNYEQMDLALIACCEL